MFQGFSDKTIDFMWGIRFNNEKTWFEAHKEEYLTHFYNPMRELGRQVFDEMTQRHGDLGLVLKVSRIYRDARRLHGRDPIRTTCGCPWSGLAARSGRAVRCSGSNWRPSPGATAWATGAQAP